MQRFPRGRRRAPRTIAVEDTSDTTYLYNKVVFLQGHLEVDRAFLQRHYPQAVPAAEVNPHRESRLIWMRGDRHKSVVVSGFQARANPYFVLRNIFLSGLNVRWACMLEVPQDGRSLSITFNQCALFGVNSLLNHDHDVAFVGCTLPLFKFHVSCRQLSLQSCTMGNFQRQRNYLPWTISSLDVQIDSTILSQIRLRSWKTRKLEVTNSIFDECILILLYNHHRYPVHIDGLQVAGNLFIDTDICAPADALPYFPGLQQLLNQWLSDLRGQNCFIEEVEG